MADRQRRVFISLIENMADRQRRVFISLIDESLRYESLARHAFQRRQHRRIGNAAAPKIENQAYLACGKRHENKPFRRRNAPLWVRSTCNGVTEISPRSMVR